MSVDKKEVRVRVLSDKVTDKDELGSHEKIADSIASLIDSDPEGKAIALTGKWGSGKSSVVEMLKKKLGSETRLFVFDAWAHEGDPLRRSFLEQLIGFLEFTWFNPGYWKTMKEELTKKREVTEVKFLRKPSWLGILLAVAVLAVPIGLVMLARDPWNPSWGFPLALAPVLVAVLYIVLWYTLYMLGKWINKRFVEVKEGQGLRELLSVVSGDAKQDYRSDSYRTVDPTTIEFLEDYSKLLKESLERNSRKLVIVIDNLDRLDPKVALSMWSTMKTFLDHNLLQNQSWANRLWLLVPFDASASKRLWARNNNGQGDHEDLAQSFVDKTFQVKFHVPPPVLSNWEEYFKTQFQRAFPDVKDADEIHTVYRIFRLKKFKGASFPTPREIKLFINRIGTLYRQWHDEFELRTLAMYVAIENEENIEEKLRNAEKELIYPVNIELFKGDIFIKLAAIHFNVHKDNAVHVLLGPKLEERILKGDYDYIGKMHSVTGSDEVIEEVIQDNYMNWVEERPSALARIANALSKPDSGSDSLINVWDNLCDGASKVKTWDVLSSKVGLGISDMVKHSQLEQFPKAVLTSLSNTVPKPQKEEKQISDKEIQEWLGGCRHVFESIEDLHGAKTIQDVFRCPGEAETYMQILEQAISVNWQSDLIQYLRPRVSIENVVGAISKSISNKKFTSRTRTALSYLLELEPEVPCAGLVSPIESRLQSEINSTSADVSALLGTLIDLSLRFKEAGTALVALSTKGYCFNHLFRAQNEKNPPATALCLFTILKYNPSTAPSSQEGSIMQGVQRYADIKANPEQISFALKELTDLIIDNNDIDLLWNLTSDAAMRPLIYAIIGILVKRSDLVEIATVTDFLEHESTFSSALDEKPYQDTVHSYVKDAGLIDELLKSDFVPARARLCKAAYVSDEVPSDPFQNWLIEGLRNIKKDEWMADFNIGTDSLFDLVLVLRRKNVRLDLSIEFQEALNSYMLRFNQDDRPIAPLSENWSDYLTALDKSVRDTFLAGVIDNIVESREPHGKVLSLFGSTLLECERLEGKKNDLVQKGFKKFVDADRIDELRWFAKAVRTCPNIVEKCNKSYRENLKKLVSQRLSQIDVEDEKRKILEQIAEVIGVTVPSEEEEIKDESDE